MVKFCVHHCLKLLHIVCILFMSVVNQFCNFFNDFLLICILFEWLPGNIHVPFVEFVRFITFNHVQVTHIFGIYFSSHNKFVSRLEAYNIFISSTHNVDQHIQKGYLHQKCLNNEITPKQLSTRALIIVRSISQVEYK